eukprot:28605-Pelagomonas_calceolata.AAC.3
MGRGRQWLVLCKSFADSSWLRPASLPGTHKLAKQKLFTRTAKPATSGPQDGSSRHELHQHTFVNALAGSWVWGCPIRKLCSSHADHSSLPMSQRI